MDLCSREAPFDPFGELPPPNWETSNSTLFDVRKHISSQVAAGAYLSAKGWLYLLTGLMKLLEDRSANDASRPIRSDISHRILIAPARYTCSAALPVQILAGFGASLP